MTAFDRVRARFLNRLRATKIDVPAFIVWQRFRKISLTRRSTAFYREFIKPGDLVFDVGANLGEKTNVFLELGASVVAVEPQPVCLQKLRSRFGANPKVRIVPKALGERPGKADMSICGSESGISTLSDRWKDRSRFSGHDLYTEVRSVEVTTLDLLMAEYGQPAFCKIDVEGFEPFVIAGLSKPIRFLSFEFMREFLDDTQKCAELLSALGHAEFNYSRGESLTLKNRTWQSARDLVAELRGNEEQLFWGDIYVRFPAAGGG
jgi:FkbM family methyltransferase